MCQSRGRLEGGWGGGEGHLLPVRSRQYQDWIVVLVVFNRDQHAGNLTLRYLSGVMSGRLMKGTEDVRSVPAISVHVTSSHDLCTSFEKKPVDASPIQSWRSRQCTESKFPAPANPPPPQPPTTTTTIQSWHSRFRTESKSGYPDYSTKKKHETKFLRL